MTRIVQALAAGGLVRRQRDAHDGRVVRLTATAKGRRVMQSARVRRIDNLAALFGRLSPTEIEQVRTAAELVEKALAQQP
jgi:DNA-binding MarR family transcriptional regulator